MRVRRRYDWRRVPGRMMPGRAALRDHDRIGIAGIALGKRITGARCYKRASANTDIDVAAKRSNPQRGRWPAGSHRSLN